MTAPESQNPPPLGYSTLPVPNPVDITAILHQQDTRPAAPLSTESLRDGANHQPAPVGAKPMSTDTTQTPDDFSRSAELPDVNEAHGCVTGANGRCTCPMPAYRLLDQPSVIAAIAIGTVALVIAWAVLAMVTR